MLTQFVHLQEQKKRELEEMNRVFAELGIETSQVQADKKAEIAGTLPSLYRCCKNRLNQSA